MSKAVSIPRLKFPRDQSHPIVTNIDNAIDGILNAAQNIMQLKKEDIAGRALYERYNIEDVPTLWNLDQQPGARAHGAAHFLAPWSASASYAHYKYVLALHVYDTIKLKAEPEGDRTRVNVPGVGGFLVSAQPPNVEFLRMFQAIDDDHKELRQLARIITVCKVLDEYDVFPDPPQLLQLLQGHCMILVSCYLETLMTMELTGGYPEYVIRDTPLVLKRIVRELLPRLAPVEVLINTTMRDNLNLFSRQRALTDVCVSLTTQYPHLDQRAQSMLCREMTTITKSTTFKLKDYASKS